MWFLLSLAALVCWSGSDLFSKIGCRAQDDRLSHLKMVVAVGFVMGLHCLYEVTLGGVSLTPRVLFSYLPVSLLYILSMALGYLGLRYIELSISSPICNSSGALVAILTIVTAGRAGISNWQLLGVALTCVGVILLGVVEYKENPISREARQSPDYKYVFSVTALLLPLLYCVLDALGTFADSLVLQRLDESAANAAYEFTFFLTGLGCLLYVLAVKKEKFKLREEGPKYIGACFETVGQVAYIFALSDTAHVALSAPIISSYCALSVLWSRVFLKEKLSGKHYLALIPVFLGILIMGACDV